MVKRTPSSKAHYWCYAKETGYVCSKCKHQKRRCEGCDKIICRCDKRNDHIVGTDLYICYRANSEQ